MCQAARCPSCVGVGVESSSRRSEAARTKTMRAVQWQQQGACVAALYTFWTARRAQMPSVQPVGVLLALSASISLSS